MTRRSCATGGQKKHPARMSAPESCRRPVASSRSPRWRSGRPSRVRMAPCRFRVPRQRSSNPRPGGHLLWYKFSVPAARLTTHTHTHSSTIDYTMYFPYTHTTSVVTSHVLGAQLYCANPERKPSVLRPAAHKQPRSLCAGSARANTLARTPRRSREFTGVNLLLLSILTSRRV